jgi:hypothetical protein
MKRLVLTLLACTFVVAGASAEKKKFPGIQNLMTPEEYEKAGLDQLSDEQIEALDLWLLGYTALESAIIRQQTDIEEIKQAEKDFAVITRIKGDFKGWDGDTVFRLENGQIWRQRNSGRYVYVGPPNPEVSITRNIMGFYKLTVVEKDRGVGVKLVQ